RIVAAGLQHRRCLPVECGDVGAWFQLQPGLDAVVIPFCQPGAMGFEDAEGADVLELETAVGGEVAEDGCYFYGDGIVDDEGLPYRVAVAEEFFCGGRGEDNGLGVV